jgi:hypothetical protein
MVAYVNGIAVDTIAASTHNIQSYAGNNLYLGALYGTQYFFTGSFDEVAVWNTALTAAQIQTIYSRQIAQYSGNFTSRVLSTTDPYTSWNALSWVTTLPFFKPLPDAGCSETQASYSALTDNSLMSENVGLWHLDEPSGTSGAGSVIDHSGMGASGTPGAGVTFGEPGKIGSAARFSGTATGQITLTQPMNLSSANATISAWAYLNSTSLSGAFMKFGGCDNGYALGVGNSNFNANPGNELIALYEQTRWIPTGVNIGLGWHHVVLAIDASGHPTIYLDGLSVYSDLLAAPSAPDANQYIGGYDATSCGFGGTLRFFTGLMDEVAVWNRALSSTEVLQLYRRGANRIKYQVRPCADSACAANPSWQGPDGTNQSYFSELYNNSAQSSYQGLWTGSPAAFPYGGDPSLSFSTLSSLPDLIFSAFTNLSGLTASSDPYIQYRAILESDDTSTECTYDSTSVWCSPELQSVTLQTK